jgi:hypothetical protein
MVTNFIIINYKSVIAIKLQIRYSYFELIIIVSLGGGGCSFRNGSNEQRDYNRNIIVLTLTITPY